MPTLKERTYQAIDIITFHKGIARRIGGEAVRFPARWSRYYEADYEPETFAFFRKNLKPGNTVLDIGAHIGLFAVVTAKLVGPTGKVFSFEPTPSTREVLKEVVRLNGCGDVVEVRDEAVSREPGKAVFHDTGTDISNANSLVNIERSKNTFEVEVVSVDAFVRSRNLRPDCLKIDVEGAELDLLRGAEETFTKIRPVARLGLHPPQVARNHQSLEEIWDVLSDYKLDVEYCGKTATKDWFCQQTDLFDVTLIPVG
jgi:FkbM family methyltransferase